MDEYNKYIDIIIIIIQLINIKLKSTKIMKDWLYVSIWNWSSKDIVMSLQLFFFSIYLLFKHVCSKDRLHFYA